MKFTVLQEILCNNLSQPHRPNKSLTIAKSNYEVVDILPTFTKTFCTFCLASISQNLTVVSMSAVKFEWWCAEIFLYICELKNLTSLLIFTNKLLPLRSTKCVKCWTRVAVSLSHVWVVGLWILVTVLRYFSTHLYSYCFSAVTD